MLLPPAQHAASLGEQEQQGAGGTPLTLEALVQQLAESASEEPEAKAAGLLARQALRISRQQVGAQSMGLLLLRAPVLAAMLQSTMPGATAMQDTSCHGPPCLEDLRAGVLLFHLQCKSISVYRLLRPHGACCQAPAAQSVTPLAWRGSAAERRFLSRLQLSEEPIADEGHRAGTRAAAGSRRRCPHAAAAARGR